MESEFHPPFNWRDHLRVHPAADLFPLLAETDPKALQELAEDIRKNGLQAPIILASIPLCNDAGLTTGKYNKPMLLDGRNRLDALALLGWLEVAEKPKRRSDYRLHYHIPIKVKDDIDWGLEFKFVSTLEAAPEVLYETAISLNLHRRHLTAEQKRDLIAKLLKAQPEKSNREIAGAIKVDHKTVGRVRAEKEATGEIPRLKKTTGKDGKARKQPAKRKTDDPTFAALRERAARHGLRIRKRGSEWITIDADGKSIGFAWLAAHPGATMEDFEQALPPAPTGCNLDDESPESGPEPHAAEQTPLQPSDDAEANAKARKAHYAAEERPVPERTAEPQASDADAASAEKREANYAKAEKTESNRFHREVSQWVSDFAHRFRVWCNTTTLTDEAKRSLHDVLMLAADELMTLAQEVDGGGTADRAANSAEAAPLIPDDLSIPEFLRREKDDIAGKAAA